LLPTQKIDYQIHVLQYAIAKPYIDTYKIKFSSCYLLRLQSCFSYGHRMMGTKVDWAIYWAGIIKKFLGPGGGAGWPINGSAIVHDV
jgi:hypothetical protein